MDEWKEYKLGEICNINKNSYSKKDNYCFVNYLDTGNLTENTISEIQRIDLSIEELPSRAKRKVTDKSILYSTVRPNQKHFGIIKNIPKNFLVSTGFAVIDTIESKADPYFLYYYLSRDEITTTLHAIAEQSTSAYPAIKPTDIMDLTITLPPLSTQKKIAAVLSSLDDKIELNRQINANLEQQAQAIFKNWFVDFEPFGGEMPAGWRVGKLSEIIDIRDGTHDSPKFQDNGYPLVTSKHLDSFGIFFSDMKYITEEDYKKINERSKVDTGDILYSMIGTVGNISLVIDNPVKFAIKNVGLFKTSQNPIYKYFVLNYLKSKDIRNYIDQHLAGSTQKYISLSELRNIPFLISDLKVLEEYNLIVEPIIELITNNVNENKTLASIRDTLLPKLMSGELQV